MAKWSFSVLSWTPVAVADTTNMTDNGYMGLLGGSTTQRIGVTEVSMSGLAGASSPTIMVLSRDTTVEATPTALAAGQSNAPLDPATVALAAPQVAFTASTTKPQRSATAHLLALGFNAFGGIYRYMAREGSEPFLVGNTQPLGELSLGAFTGGTPGLMSAHIQYEPSASPPPLETELGDRSSRTHRHHRSRSNRVRLAAYI